MYWYHDYWKGTRDFLCAKCKQFHQKKDQPIPGSAAQLPQPSTQPSPRATNNCPFCYRGIHNIMDCFKFKGKSAKARTECMKQLGFCFKCFTKYKPGACRWNHCDFCEKAHNPLLYYKKENAVRTRVASKNHITEEKVQKTRYIRHKPDIQGREAVTLGTAVIKV